LAQNKPRLKFSILFCLCGSRQKLQFGFSQSQGLITPLNSTTSINLDSSNRWYLSSGIQVTFYHISQALHDKSFSEEVFEGIDQEGLTYTTAATLPRSELPEQHESNTRVWKSRTPSETASLHSHDASSVHGSSVSRDYRVLAEQKSYYSSFKPQKASSESQSQISTNSDSIREKIATHSVKTSGTKKVFTFDLK
jgi:hypothetical protein